MRTFKFFITLTFMVCVSSICGQGLLNGLQACYPLDCDNAINMAVTGPALNGTPVNVTCTTGHTGLPNTAYAFANSPSSYIQLPNDYRIKPDTISFSAWVNFNNTTTPQYIVFAKNSCMYYFEGYTLVAAPVAGNFILQLVKSGSACSPSTQQILNGVTPISPGWHHVAFYMGSDDLEIYLDGALENTATSFVTFNYSATDNVYLGGTTASWFNYPLDGDMDNVRFYNRRLSASEFNQIYTSDPACDASGLPGLLSGLEACYPLDCDWKNYAPTAAVPPSLDGTGYTVRCDVGHTGVVNTAYRFFGVPTSYIELPNDPRLKTGAISFSGWSKINSLSSNQYILFTDNGCASFFEGYALVATDVGGGNIQYSVTKSIGSPFCGSFSGQLISSGVYAAAAWHHVVFYMDATDIKLYVDGALDNTITTGPAIAYSATGRVYLGGTNASFNYPFNGVMDDLRFYSRELTAQEVSILYKHSPSCSDTWCANPDCSKYNNKLSAPEGLTVNAPDVAIELYPNPSNGKLFLRNGQGKSLTIYDVTGKKVEHTITAIDGNVSEINFENKANGFYFVRILDEKGNLIQSVKIVITP